MTEPPPPLPKSQMTQAQRGAYEAVRRLLRDEWNPIDVVGLPDDEYDSYAPTLFTLIDRGGSVDEAARFLAVVETAFMGGRERPERNAAVGAKAHAIVTAAKSPE